MAMVFHVSCGCVDACDGQIVGFMSCGYCGESLLWPGQVIGGHCMAHDKHTAVDSNV